MDEQPDDVSKQLKKPENIPGAATYLSEVEPADEGPGASKNNDSIHTEVQHLVFTCPVDHSGTSVYVKGWVKADTTSPPLLVVHDLGENTGFYREFAKLVGEAGLSVFAFDLRGHGRSGRGAEPISNFQPFVNDLLQVVAWIRHLSEGVLPVILGQGVGSLITMYFQRRHPRMCQRLILSAPCLQPPRSMSWFQRFFLWSLAELAPRARVPGALGPKFMNPGGKGRSLATGQPVRISSSGLKAHFAKDLLQAVDAAQGEFTKLDCSTLFLCPEKSSEFDYHSLHTFVQSHPHCVQFFWVTILGESHHFLTDDAASQSIAVAAIVDWIKQGDHPGHHL